MRKRGEGGRETRREMRMTEGRKREGKENWGRRMRKKMRTDQGRESERKERKKEEREEKKNVRR